MSKNEKEICFKCNQKQRDQIKKNAKACGMKQGDYILQRALGYAPKEQKAGIYVDLYRKLCEITNMELSPKTEAHLLELIDRIYNRLFESIPPSEETLLDESRTLNEIHSDIGDD